MAPAELSIRVGQALQARGWTLITAESCTGGWIAKAVTDVAGSSAWFEGGIVAYGNAAKQALLGVDASTLAAHGAVSAQTVAAMAAGALARGGADLAVAVSGIAGPGGGSDAKPVGTVWLAWARRGQPPWTCCLHLAGDRDAVRRQAVSAALEGVLDAAAG